MTFQAEENLGMVMVFTIVSALQEKLNEMMEYTAKHKQEEEERKAKELEEAERVSRISSTYNFN